MTTADTLVRDMHLEAHPEGGWFRRTWTAPARLMTPNGERASASAILFLLDRDMEARWHVVRSDELWLWHGPGNLEVHLGGNGAAPCDSPEIVTLCAPRTDTVSGDTVDSAEQPSESHKTPHSANPVQILVKAGTWQRTFAREAHALATCVVSPEFTFDDWKLAE